MEGPQRQDHLRRLLRGAKIWAAIRGGTRVAFCLALPDPDLTKRNHRVYLVESDDDTEKAWSLDGIGHLRARPLRTKS